MKAKKGIILLLSLLLFTGCSSNEDKTKSDDRKDNRYLLDDSQVCKSKNQSSITEEEIKPIKQFKDSLTFTIHSTKSHAGTVTYLDTITFSERIKDETSIVKVSEKVAVRFCIGRVTVNNQKKYIYQIHLYQKVNNCWKDANESVSWEAFNLGKLCGGYALGDFGTAEAVGFIGDVTIQ